MLRAEPQEQGSREEEKYIRRFSGKAPKFVDTIRTMVGEPAAEGRCSSFIEPSDISIGKELCNTDMKTEAWKEEMGRTWGAE